MKEEKEGNSVRRIRSQLEGNGEDRRFGFLDGSKGVSTVEIVTCFGDGGKRRHLGGNGRNGTSVVTTASERKRREKQESVNRGEMEREVLGGMFLRGHVEEEGVGERRLERLCEQVEIGVKRTHLICDHISQREIPKKREQIKSCDIEIVKRIPLSRVTRRISWR